VLIDDFHHIRHLTFPHRHALYAWVSPSPRVRCRKASVTYLLTYMFIAFLNRDNVKVVRSHSLGEFWKSALHKSMSAKAPGAGEGGERMDNDGAKGVKSSLCSSLRGHFPCSLFNAKLGFWAGFFTCVGIRLYQSSVIPKGFPRSILKVLS
jgi:hypothetical protein